MDPCEALLPPYSTSQGPEDILRMLPVLVHTAICILHLCNRADRVLSDHHKFAAVQGSPYAQLHCPRSLCAVLSLQQPSMIGVCAGCNLFIAWSIGAMLPFAVVTSHSARTSPSCPALHRACKLLRRFGVATGTWTVPLIQLVQTIASDETAWSALEQHPKSLVPSALVVTSSSCHKAVCS